ncbi:MAG TPA: dihydrofolate reductase family protein [Solirubrobacteraceae bacterium]|nr:dihydrofolate reductase family protein [Solirubrobacteraceae bacterium]
MTPSVISAAEPIEFRRLLPAGKPAGAREIVLGLGLHELPPEGAARAHTRARPHVLLNMVSTVDGRATLGGRSAPLSDPADRALFHGLRTVVDAVMAGAGTVRDERYGPIVPDPDKRRARAELGLREQPLACVVSKSLAFPPDLPLLADPDSTVAILTPSPGQLPSTTAASVDYVRARRPDGSLDLGAALSELQDRLHVTTVLCEGGPRLNTELMAGGLVDELFLSLSPTLAGGDPAGGERAPRILAGMELETPARLRLACALEHDSRLFLRYSVRPGD